MVILLCCLSLIAVFGLTACTRALPGASASYTTTVSTGNDHMGLNATSSRQPSIDPGAPEACIDVKTSVSGRDEFCRLVWGWDGNNDHRQWRIAFTIGNSPGGSPPVVETDDAGSKTITVEDGTTYEGCYWTSPDDAYHCDFRTTKQFIAGPGGCSNVCYFLDKLWNWTHYELAPDIGCAGGAARILTKKVGVTLPFLADCSEKPWNGGG